MGAGVGIGRFGLMTGPLFEPPRVFWFGVPWDLRRDAWSLASTSREIPRYMLSDRARRRSLSANGGGPGVFRTRGASAAMRAASDRTASLTSPSTSDSKSESRKTLKAPAQRVVRSRSPKTFWILQATPYMPPPAKCRPTTGLIVPPSEVEVWENTSDPESPPADQSLLGEMGLIRRQSSNSWPPVSVVS